MATAKRKQEELGEECDDQEPHDNDPCSDDDDAKRPRLDLHHQHIPHHQLPHHRQWSNPPGACGEVNKPEPFEACASEISDVKDVRELDIDSSVSTRSFDNEYEGEYKGFVNYDKDKFQFNHARNSNDGKFNDSNSYYLNFGNLYPEYVVPRTFCKERNTDDSPCDLSNWQVRSSKFEQDLEENNRELTNASEIESERESLQNGENVDDDNVQQPINFAYYHF